jgi:peptide/nickel transport system substrate-binding protein
MPALTRRAGFCAAVLAFAFAFAACGGGDDEETPAVSSATPVGEGGTLVWAVADPVSGTDPLEASTRAEEILVRQVNEPLTAKVSGPFDLERRVPGLAVKAQSSAGDSIWTFTLREGAVFQDGTPFNAIAVQANATRWLTTAAGRALLPGLISIDAPSPGSVRFVLAAPDPDFRKRLAAPQLGIVSPSALSPSSGDGAVLRRSSQTGTGAFEIRDRGGSDVLLARNTSWWGSSAKVELGPALDQIELKSTPESGLRLAMLDAGEAELADELSPNDAKQASSDPLLSVLPSRGGTSLGLERSVRGVDSGREIPALSSAWLTGLPAAD